MKKLMLWGGMIAWVLFLIIVILLVTSCRPEVDPIKADHITVEVYWASYCPYCIQELMVLDEISGELVGHPYLEGKVEIVAACVDLEPEDLQAVLISAGYTFKMTSGEKLPPWSNGLPTVVIRDAEGKAVFQSIGFMDKAQLYSAIMGALGFTEKI